MDFGDGVLMMELGREGGCGKSMELLRRLLEDGDAKVRMVGDVEEGDASPSEQKGPPPTGLNL